MQKFANFYGYSDVEPYEVISSTAKTISIRAMGSKLAEGQKPEIIPGGFVGHCTNQRELKWDIWPDPKAPVIKAYLRKDGNYYSKYGKHRLSDEPAKFYDFNF
jgi:hypothetical protein